MLKCCGAEEHQWDVYEVELRWVPETLRCLIIGENPGDSTAQYFYDKPFNYNADPVVVRSSLLQGLRRVGLIREASLAAFRDAGFLFDHAIRCQLPARMVGVERQKASRYSSSLVASPVHLKERLSQAQLIWVMGHLACNAIANLTADFPKEKRKISMTPYPCGITSSSRIFVSEYFSWRTVGKAQRICEAFGDFAGKHAEKQRCQTPLLLPGSS